MRRSLIAALALTLGLGSACKKDTSSAEAPPAAESASAPDQAPKEAPKAEAESEAQTTAARLENPFLWKVTSPDGKVSHVFGTIHLGVDAQSRLPAEVWTAFDEATSLVLEADLADPSALSSMMRQDGKTLEAELGPEAWAKLEEILGESMAQGLQNMKASTAAALIMVKAMPMTTPMDLVLLQKAKSSGKELLYLETLAQQQKLLDELMDAEFVRELLDHYDQVVAMSKKTLAAYETGDADELVTVMTTNAPWEDPAEAEASREKLLYGRNEAWIPKLEEWFQRGGVFVAVGAGHLPGERGVIDLLRAKGYQIERVE